MAGQHEDEACLPIPDNLEDEMSPTTTSSQIIPFGKDLNP
jgi:hypothetical protein